MKKSLVLMILLVLISGFAFADEGKFSADYYNFAGFSIPDFDYVDIFAIDVTYEAENYALNFDVRVDAPNWNYYLTAAGEYFFKNTEEETFGIYGSFTASSVKNAAGSAHVFADTEVVALDFSKTLNYGDKFWAAPGVVRYNSKFNVEVPASYFLDRDNSAWYFVNEAVLDMPAESLSDFRDDFSIQGYIKSIETHVTAGVLYKGGKVSNVNGSVLFEKVLPFEEKGKFTFNHPTEIYATYSAEDGNYVNVSTELISGKFNDDIFGLNLNEISTSLSLDSNYSIGLDIEFAFDTAKRNDDLTVDFNVGYSLGGYTPSFGIYVLYSPKAPETPYDFNMVTSLF